MASLRDLGLSEYEARAYRALLSAGPTTARELSDESGVPMGRVYDVLGSLETCRLARSQTGGRPKKYVAVEPATGLDRLLEERKRELAETASQYEEAVAELKRDLEPAVVDDGEFWTAAVGADEVLALLLERLDAAEDRVVMVAPPLSTGFDVGDVGSAVHDRLAAAADRGVTVDLLAAYELASAVPEPVAARYRDLVADREDVTVRVAGAADVAVTVVDGRETCVEVPHPIEPQRAFAMVDLEDEQFARAVLSTVDSRWADATAL